MTVEYRTDRMRVKELEREQPMRQILADLCERELSLDEMAVELGVDKFTVHRWLKKFGARRRYVLPSLTADPTDASREAASVGR